MTNQLVHKCNEQGVFSSPLDEYDPAKMDAKWDTMEEFIEDMLLHTYPQSTITEVRRDRKITYSHLFKTGQDVARQMIAAGVEKGALVHVTADNDLDCASLLVACYINGYKVSGSHPNSPWAEIYDNLYLLNSPVLVLNRTLYNKLVATFADFG